MKSKFCQVRTENLIGVPCIVNAPFKKLPDKSQQGQSLEMAKNDVFAEFRERGATAPGEFSFLFAPGCNTFKRMRVGVR